MVTLATPSGLTLMNICVCWWVFKLKGLMIHLKSRGDCFSWGDHTQMFKGTGRRRKPESSFYRLSHRLWGARRWSVIIANTSALMSQLLQDSDWTAAPVCRPRPGALCCRWSCCLLHLSCASPPPLPRNGHRTPSSCCLPQHKEKTDCETQTKGAALLQKNGVWKTNRAGLQTPPPKKKRKKEKQPPATNKRLTDAWATWWKQPQSKLCK